MAVNSYVCLYLSYLDTLKPFSDAEQGRLMMAMLSYASTGEEPSFEGNEKYIWPSIKSQIDRDQKAYWEKCEKNQLNGAKGGRPRNQTVFAETEGFSEKPKKAKEKDMENDNENANTNTKTRESKKDTAEAAEADF